MTYQLPDGTITSDESRYRNEWRKLTRDVAEALDCVVASADPIVVLRERDNVHQFWLAPKVAQRIVDLYNNQKPKENDDHAKH